MFKVLAEQEVNLQAGFEFHLLCDGGDNWKKCTWTRALEKGRQCVFEYEYLNDNNGDKKWHISKKDCDPPLDGTLEQPDVSKTGTKNQKCKLSFTEATFDQQDKWTCTLQSCKPPMEGGCKSVNGSKFRSNATIDVKVI